MQGDIRGKLKVDKESAQINIDHSGLYIIIKSHLNKLELYELATG